MSDTQTTPDPWTKLNVERLEKELKFYKRRCEQLQFELRKRNDR